MNGFRAEQGMRDGKSVWILYSLDTQKVLAVGNTVLEAVLKMQEEHDDG